MTCEYPGEHSGVPRIHGKEGVAVGRRWDVRRSPTSTDDRRHSPLPAQVTMLGDNPNQQRQMRLAVLRLLPPLRQLRTRQVFTRTACVTLRAEQRGPSLAGEVARTGQVSSTA